MSIHAGRCRVGGGSSSVGPLKPTAGDTAPDTIAAALAEAEEDLETPFDVVDVSACRSQQLLSLKPAAVEQMRALAQDAKIVALWQELCPKAAAQEAAQEAALQKAAAAVAAAAAKAAGRRTTRAAAASASASTVAPTAHFDPHDIVGKKVSKHFAGAGYCIGDIIEYREDLQYKHLYRIKYSDGDSEDVTRPVALKLIARYNTTHGAGAVNWTRNPPLNLGRPYPL